MGNKENLQHPSDEVIEQYSLNRLADTEVERMEEHLLLCEHCQDRVELADGFITATKQALREIQREELENPPKASFWERWRSPMPRFVFGAVAALALVLVIVPRRAPESQTIDMTSYRSVSAPTAKANANLSLNLNTEGLPQQPSYWIDVVNGRGASVWQGESRAEGTVVKAAPGQLSADQYWVRIYPAQSQPKLIREFSLLVQ